MCWLASMRAWAAAASSSGNSWSITGATRPAQVAENASVSDLPPLGPELHDRLAQFYRAEVAPAICVPV